MFYQAATNQLLEPQLGHHSLQCRPQELREIQLTKTVPVPRDVPAWPWGAGGNCTAAPGAADTAWRGGRAAGAGGREAASGTWTAAGLASSCSPGCRRAAPGRSTASPAPGLGWATVDCSWRRWSWHASGSRDCGQAQNCSSVMRKAVWWRINFAHFNSDSFYSTNSLRRFMNGFDKSRSPNNINSALSKFLTPTICELIHDNL